MSDMFTPIDDTDLLADILSGARGRGDYKTVIGAFIESGHRLVEVPLTAGLFEGKKAQTVKTGFENAKNAKEPVEGSDKVKVVKKGDQIYLVNQAVTA
jgi:coenzyme F420-reducing hydrogenase beta subunit